MIKRFFLLLVLTATLTGCMLQNDVKSLSENFSVPKSKNHAIVIYGIGLESKWSAPGFGIILDEYNLEKQSITGNCSSYNRMEAIISSVTKGVEYFAFKVPAGYYTYSGFNAAGLNSKKEMDSFISDSYQPKKSDISEAYSTAINKVSYIGDFIFTEAGYVVLRRDLDLVKADIKKKFPNLRQNIELATPVPISPPGIFLCTP